MNRSIFVAISTIFAGLILLLPPLSAQSLKPDVPAKFTINGKQAYEFMVDLRSDDVCNISTNATDEMPISLAVVLPSGEELVDEVYPAKGYVFVANMPGTYVVRFYVSNDLPDEMVTKFNGTQVTVRYSNKFTLPLKAKTVARRTINGYQAKIANETGDDSSTYFLIQKAGKLKAVMRTEKEFTDGYYFSDDPDRLDGANAKASAALMRTTTDKTGDGTPDLAVEYYSGGAHCCFEITFFELGDQVRQLKTIETDNDRLTAISKNPGGGLRFRSTEQAFAYWNINFAQSPMPTVIYEFDKSDKFVARFDLMRKPAPSLMKLKRDAAAAKAKINLNPYTSPEDNFNDWEEPFWGYMLDLIYTGHEDQAWQYFELVWPSKKKGKEKFLADFKEQLAFSTYGTSTGK